MAMLREAAISGLATSLPNFLHYDAINNGLLKPVLTDYEWTSMTSAVYPKTTILPKRTRGFVDFISTRYGMDPTGTRFTLDFRQPVDRGFPHCYVLWKNLSGHQPLLPDSQRLPFKQVRSGAMPRTKLLCDGTHTKLQPHLS